MRKMSETRRGRAKTLNKGIKEPLEESEKDTTRGS